ncbi:MAG: hypothetical protein A2700_02090 [Candidatus Blackburnbacteria bacterium RIFCSPHIGHO2_01_FULL_44_64]|uniref:Uncharacterized protein n=1 Tax=Candidatus Blackburnbacteria bacterium RIFCSPHIGHO2_02_FULL_44_20 TaxID=1797516 RepID=A0A1G1V864_9BACT|nr:MAG: hypothetical protein A2700_02090 [Candidatus Blackburnbacteria bacterium RIFCSPHIGHO2_01_FULL_44_64]OGY11194.1 MAG: hypothetical protein A3E16_00320 [Candidatus Blackburnbacteria bacterium RIFCSPHIGHO2_12_FULL_44_25]OGY11481.1 MAG: hypothetical protein A3D26_04630 [Candidatus Blackburnbacteria bacterium RIFCSPHIGHO2_02_FULL_44_20]OGY15164.1 MAG: hypothetical protein A3A62_01385 [Candidatus Blackburnbacteria bacterium RIFCSPLOWO2_01_FULL_44_43]
MGEYSHGETALLIGAVYFFMPKGRGGKERTGEYEVSPEVIRGSPIRIPAIVGRGSGGGFDVENLCVPQGWGGVVGELGSIDEDRIQRMFAEDCRGRGLAPGRVVLDPSTHLLREVGLTDSDGRVGKVALSESLAYRERGIYEMVGVFSADAAIALTKVVAQLLTPLTIKLQPERPLVPYVDGRSRGFPAVYYSRSLVVPREWLEPGDELTTERQRFSFLLEASNIAGRFGLTLARRAWQFTERGLLRDICIKEGNACTYSIETEDSIHPNEYVSHNVDTPHQALALHGIVAAHVNSILDRIELKREG